MQVYRASKVTSALVAIWVLAIISAGASISRAQGGPLDNLYPNFFKPQNPPQLSVLGFVGGYASDKYGTMEEGFQLEQSVTKYVGVFGRLTGYQLWIGGGFDSPLQPGAGHFARLNFGRAQGGIDFAIYPGTHVYVSGGKDFADSSAAIIEGDISSWFLLHSFHPINLSVSVIHDYENDVTSSEFDIQAILRSTEGYILMAGGGGAWYSGGFLTSDQGQGGPDLGFYYRPWQIGVSAQAGYGSAHQYAQISMYKELDFPNL